MELDFHKNPQILGDIVDAMPLGVFTLDVDGCFVAWSQGAERITGFPAAEVLGRSCKLLEGPHCKGFASLAELLRAPPADDAGICNQECKILARDEQEKFIHGSVRLIRDPQGTVVGAVGAFGDMTSFVLANEKIALLEKQTGTALAFERLVGKSRPMKEIFRRLELAADSDVTVLVTGESGTGKELAAAAIHARSARRQRPFMAINCSAIPETLLESELFGHIRGAFTGATRDKLGLFQAADGGTLFLDEIGDVSPAIQVKLLRVLQERVVRRVGDERGTQVDVRLITATNRDPYHLVASGAMREDFFYRIHVFEIHLPPLRERRDDIPLLVDAFVREFRQSTGKAIDGVARDALEALRNHDWPGNVRQLRSAIEHAFVTASGDRLSLWDLPPDVQRPRQPRNEPAGTVPSAAEVAERQQIVEALRRVGGNRTRAAALLGFSRVTLWKKMNRLAIPPDDPSNRRRPQDTDPR